MDAPLNVTVSHFLSTYARGRDLLDKIAGVSPTLLLRGYTELRYQNYVDALANLWIVTEQLTELLWRNDFLADGKNHPAIDISNRRKALREDGRTWSISVRQEILFQKGILGDESFAALFTARKARNDLVHAGKSPPAQIVQSLFAAIIDLVEILSGMRAEEIRKLPVDSQVQFADLSTSDMNDWNETAARHL